MMDAAVSQEAKQGARRKSETRLHILPALTIVVLLYALVMTLTWLRDQTSISLVTRPYAVATSSDDSATTSTILTTLRGWMSAASNSAQSMVESQPVQAIRETVISVIADFRGLFADDAGIAARNSLWIRYLPLEDASQLLAER
jgi:hypothetical protein